MNQFNVLHYVKVMLLSTALTFLLSLPLIMFASMVEMYIHTSQTFYLALLGLDLLVIHALMPTYKASYYTMMSNLTKRSIPRTELTSLSLIVFVVYMITLAELLVKAVSVPFPGGMLLILVSIYLALTFIYVKPSMKVLAQIDRVIS